MTARIPLLLAVRLQLMPQWLASLIRRAPGAVVALIVALALIVVAGVVFAAVYGPDPVCHLRVVAGARSPVWVCVRGGVR
jgi:hypothetical protein